MTNDISKKKGKSSTDKKAKRKAKRRETYAMYIYKVLKQVSAYLATPNFPAFFPPKFQMNSPLPSVIKGSSGYGDFKQSHEHHDLLRERPV